jgi:(p)ppGpp synthase/HD superfamily hydrolase
MSDLVTQARIFATAAHAAVGQKRKHTGEDYIVHPTAVAMTLPVTIGDEYIAAAFLHDVVEDTFVTHIQIKDMFGEKVCKIVKALTDEPFIENGANRKARKAIDRERLSKADAGTQSRRLNR